MPILRAAGRGNGSGSVGLDRQTDQALQLDPSVALVLPCNVVLEPSADGGTHIMVVDPRELIPDADFAELAGAAAAQLTAALDALHT